MATVTNEIILELKGPTGSDKGILLKLLSEHLMKLGYRVSNSPVEYSVEVAGPFHPPPQEINGLIKLQREGKHKALAELFTWACERLNAETADRPDENIHKKTLVGTWCQVIRKLEEEIRANLFT